MGLDTEDSMDGTAADRVDVASIGAPAVGLGVQGKGDKAACLAAGIVGVSRRGRRGHWPPLASSGGAAWVRP
jgi:hypothetical protein